MLRRYVRPLLLAALLSACSRGGGNAQDLGEVAADAAGGPPDATQSTDGPDGLCGRRRCHAEQSCLSQTCTFACSGARVPGDYASLQAALDAIGPVGGVICLGARTFSEDASAAPAPGREVEVVGVSPDLSVISRLRIGPAMGKLVLRGVGVAEGITITQANVQLTACSVRGTATQGAVAITAQSPGFFSVIVDRSDLQARPPQDAFSVRDPGHGGWAVAISNSYLHDSNAGIGVYQSTTVGGAANVAVFNNTLSGNALGIVSARVSGGTGSVSLTYVNNIFVRNGIGAQIFAGTAAINHRNNAFFGNTTSYDGIAVPGSGYVSQDPLLDLTAAPPSLAPGSPCGGAGDTDGAPAIDFWGKERRPRVDIGAVQSS